MAATATRYTLPNRLKELVGGPLPESNPALVAAANNRLAALAPQFDNWLNDELERLHEALETYLQASNHENAIKVHDCSHDLKGLASTYGYPLIGRLANSLCRLTFGANEGADCPPILIKAHIDAVRAAARGQIKTEDHPIALSLISELEQQVLDYLKTQ